MKKKTNRKFTLIICIIITLLFVISGYIYNSFYTKDVFESKIKNYTDDIAFEVCYNDISGEFICNEFFNYLNTEMGYYVSYTYPHSEYLEIDEEKTYCENGGKVSYDGNGKVTYTSLGGDKCHIVFVDKRPEFSSILSSNDSISYLGKVETGNTDWVFADLFTEYEEGIDVYHFFGEDIKNYVMYNGYYFRIISIMAIPYMGKYVKIYPTLIFDLDKNIEDGIISDFLPVENGFSCTLYGDTLVIYNEFLQNFINEIPIWNIFPMSIYPTNLEFESPVKNFYISNYNRTYDGDFRYKDYSTGEMSAIYSMDLSYIVMASNPTTCGNLTVNEFLNNSSCIENNWIINEAKASGNNMLCMDNPNVSVDDMESGTKWLAWCINLNTYNLETSEFWFTLPVVTLDGLILHFDSDTDGSEEHPYILNTDANELYYIFEEYTEIK